jgi:hypothetical protein
METNEALLLVGGVLLLFVVVFFVARNSLVKRRLTCPRHEEEADVEILERHDSGKPLKVKSCSLLPDPSHVDCDEDCIKS